MSIPSNTNPKLAKMKKADRRKTATDHRGAVFHALGRQSSSDFDRFMPSLSMTRSGRICVLDLITARRPGNPRLRSRSVAKGLFLRSTRMTGSYFSLTDGLPTIRPERRIPAQLHQSFAQPAILSAMHKHKLSARISRVGTEAEPSSSRHHGFKLRQQAAIFQQNRWSGCF